MHLIFSHIPKTAGTSLRYHLERSLPPGPRIFVCDNVKNAVPKACWSSFAMPSDWIFLTGHLRPDFILENNLISSSQNDIILFSVFRDPFLRIQSLYHYVRSEPAHPEHKKMQQANLFSFLLNQPVNYQYDFINTPKKLNWKILLTNTDNIQVAMKQLSELLNLPDNKLYETPIPKVNLGKYNNVEHQKFNESPEGFYDEFKDRHKKDYKILDAITLNGGAAVFSSTELQQVTA